MLVKAIVVLFWLVILYSLGSGLFYRVRDKGADDTRVMKALTWRMALSMLLFILLFVAFA